MINIGIILALLVVLISGCATVSSPTYKNIKEMDVEYGYFDEINLDEWKVKDKLCIEILDFDGRSGERWVPKVSLVVTAGEKSLYSNTAILQAKKSPVTYYFVNNTKRIDREEEQYYFDYDVKLRKPFKYSMQVYPEEVIIQIKNKKIRVPINFVPEKAHISASSVKANISYSYGDSCGGA